MVEPTVTGPLLDGRYRLIAPIARGGMSVVWYGRDEVLSRAIAVKVIVGDCRVDATFAERVRREAMAVARLTHPYIATVYDYGESADESGAVVPYIVMELVDGDSLAQVVKRGRLSWSAAVAICAQVASALAAAHQRGVVHRDITPSNVMLAVDGVKVIDFGISAIIGDNVDRQIFGTPAYLAPERLSGGPALPATDVYGLGLLLYEMLTGHLPWSAATTTQMVTAHRYVPPAPLPPIAGMPTQIVELCRRCLAVEPSRRPSSAQVSSLLSAVARYGDRGSQPPPLTRTRVLPHGVTHLVDPTAATVSIGPDLTRASRMRDHRVFLLPAVLLVVLVGCLGLARAHPYGGNLTVPRPPGTPPPVATAPPVVTAPGLVASPPNVAEAPIKRPSVACRVDYRMTSEWFFGFTAEITIANTGGVPVSGWTLRFRLPEGQRVDGGWNGRWRQDGRKITVRDMAYNHDLPPGSSVAVGFVGSVKKTVDGRPDHVTLNGHSCTMS